MDRTYMSWLQTDPRFNRAEAWSAEQFPDAEFRYFRDAGCLVCALAVMLRYYGVETADESRFDPWILNRRLIECGAFTAAADLELSYINRLYPLEYIGEIVWSRDALTRLAESALPCLVTVPGVKAERHFTALLELLSEDAIVFDPLCGEKRLSEYDRICDIRAFWPANEENAQ